MTAPRKSSPTKSAARRGYHHGNLRRTLLECGGVVDRDNGRRSGERARSCQDRGSVARGAFSPFPQPDRAADSSSGTGDGTVDCRNQQSACCSRWREFFDAISGDRDRFFRWAITNPVHFQVISTRAAIDFEGSSRIHRNIEIRAVTIRLMSLSSTSAGLPRMVLR
jgi:hypothetical protein